MVGPLRSPSKWIRYAATSMTIVSSLADEPERLRGLDRDLLEFATRCNRGAPGGQAEYPYEYLLVVARKGGGNE